MLTRLIIGLSLFSLVGLAGAQDLASGWFYRAWQTEHGLPDNSIASIAQTPDGYLWVATNGGAMRFNGANFEPLPLRNIPGLPSRQVRAMFVDREGKLWLGMERGPVIRIGEDSYRVFDREDLFKRKPMGFADDPQGRVWIAYSGAVCLIDRDDIKKISTPGHVPRGSAASLACDADGQVWLSNGGKVGRLNPKGFELVRDFKDPALRLSAARESGLWLTAGSDLIRWHGEGRVAAVATLPDGVLVNTIYESATGAVWVGTQRNGLLRAKNGLVQRVATSQAWVDCVVEDREGHLWAGTQGGGLNLIRPRAARFFGEPDGLPFPAVRSMASDTSGRIWAVSRDGQLASEESSRWQLYRGLGEEELANCVASDSDGRVWIGTRRHGLLCIDGDQTTRFRVRDGLAGMQVRSLFTASNGDVWIATDEPDKMHRLRGGKITQLDHPGKFSAIRALAERADGTIWAGSSDGRLFRVDGDRLVDESALDGPLQLSVRAMHTTPDGSLWIGYAGDGLGHLKNGVFRMITREDGLHDNFISQILDDGEGEMWLASNRGLFQVDLEELLAVSAEQATSGTVRSRVFGPNDGVPSILPSRDFAPSACRSPDGHLHFPTHSGFVEVDPSMIRENLRAPPVTLEQVIVDDQTAAFYHTRSMLAPRVMAGQTNLSLPAPRLELEPDHDKLAIQFAALSLASPESVQLRYRLKPIDKKWVEVEGQRSVAFPRLPAGDYEFQVIACNNVGVWNEEGATLGIVVQPFFWETWPFRIGAGLSTAFVAGGFVFMGLRRKHRRQLQSIAAKQAVEQERSRIARDIHDDLGASLTRITLLSQSSTSDEQPALDQIHSTSRDLMRSMEEVVWAVNPEHDTFDALANYLSNYGQGFLGIADVRCRLEMPIAPPERPLSAQIRHNTFLAYKEALNNAVKHAGASEVRISLDFEADAFILKVEDDGKGIDPKATEATAMRPVGGSGLANMKNRMDEIGGTCALHSRLGKGTTVEFHVPLKSVP